MTNREVRQYLLSNIVNAAIRAGAAVMKIYQQQSSCTVSLKEDKSPIIEADSLAHNTIKEYLGSTRIPILSEEGREMLYDERRNWELFWLVDPLDGTIEFINRTDEFTINIALMSNNKPIAAVVYIPCLKKLYIAAKDYGSSVWEDVAPDDNADYGYDHIMDNLTSLPTQTAPRQRQIIAVSRSHKTAETESHIEAIRQANPNIEIVEQGSSYKFCMLADGSVDYYVRTSGTYEWDTAAGELILAEAGGSTLALEDNMPLMYNKECLENPWFVCRGANCTIK